MACCELCCQNPVIPGPWPLKEDWTGLWAAELLLIVIYIALGIPVTAEDTKPPSDAVPAAESTQTQMEHWGSVNPENLPSMFPLTDFRGWLEQHRVRYYGWIDAGGQYASTGSGELKLGFPTPNRFSDEFLLDAAWVIVEITYWTLNVASVTGS